MDEFGKSEYGFDDMAMNPPAVEEKKGFPSWAIALIVVGVVAVLVGGVIFMGIVFLWSSSFTEVVNEGLTFAVDGEIDGTDNTLTFTVIMGTVEWSDYSVTADGITLTTTSTSSSAGLSAVFTGVGWDPDPGTIYNIRMTEIDENRQVYERDIMATY